MGITPPNRARSYKHPYPEVKWREREAAAYRKEKEARRARRAGGAGQPAAAGGAITAAPVAPPSASSPPAPPLSGPVAFLFPGQGSQAVGMLAASKDLPAVQAMLATANKVLGYDILQVCLEGACARGGKRRRLGKEAEARPEHSR